MYATDVGAKLVRLAQLRDGACASMLTREELWASEARLGEAMHANHHTLRSLLLSGLRALAIPLLTTTVAHATPIQGFVAFSDDATALVDGSPTANIETGTTFTLEEWSARWVYIAPDIFADMPTQTFSNVSFTLHQRASLTFGNSVFGYFGSNFITETKEPEYVSFVIGGHWTAGTFAENQGVTGTFPALVMITLDQPLPVGALPITAFGTMGVPPEIYNAPEPSSLALFGCGLVGFGIIILRRRRQSRNGPDCLRTREGNVMHANYRCVLSILVLVCTMLGAPAARAVVINANNYAFGTNLTNAFPGITLDNAFNPTIDDYGAFYTSPALVGTDAVLGLGPQYPSHTIGSYTVNPVGDFHQNSDWRAFEVVFHEPFDSISFETYGQPGVTVAELYGTNGDYIGEDIFSWSFCAASADDVCLVTEQNLTVEDSSSNPIGFILVATPFSSAYVTEMDIEGLPEPSSIALLAGGLLAIGIALLRRRHPAR